MRNRILLISDTHGELDFINEKALETKADFVIHAGDFGFYDEKSLVNLSPRELRLLVVHSHIKKEVTVTKQTSHQELIHIVQEHGLLGQFPDYLNGKKQFNVPVCTVWGNHEDSAVVDKLRTDLSIPNLHLLDENHCYDFDDFVLYGLGGNFLVNKKLFSKDISDGHGKVWSNLHQFGTLYKQVKNKQKQSIFVSHVSPGKESLLTRLMTHFMPNMWISGHMGAPYTCVWNQFTIREIPEVLDWLKNEMAFIEEYSQVDTLSEEALLAYNLLKQEIPSGKEWFKNMWNINLPDAKDGHALLVANKGRFALETYSKMV